MLLHAIAAAQIAMVLILAWKRAWRTEPVFVFVQILMLAEWPVLVYAIGHDRVSGYYLWHAFNQANIALTLLAGYTCLRRGSRLYVTGVLMMGQAMVKLAHYAPLDRVQQFRIYQPLYRVSRWLDLFIALSAICALLWPGKETVYAAGREEASESAGAGI